MDINFDENSVVLDLKLYNELLKMAEFAVHEIRSHENDLKRITKHVRRFNPHVDKEYQAAKAVEEATIKLQRERLKALFNTGGKQVYFREDKNLFWPVKLIKSMKHDWKMIGMRSSTEHRKFTSYEIWQHLSNFVIAGEVPTIPHPTIPGAFVKRLTQAERDAEHIATMKRCFAPRPYKIVVILKGSALSVGKEDLQGNPFEVDDQEEAKLYLKQIKCLMHDLVDHHFIAGLEKIAYETFNNDRYYKGLDIRHMEKA